MNSPTVVSLSQIRDELDLNSGNAHANVMALLEKPLMEQALIKTYGNITKAAEILGMSRCTFRKRLEIYGLMRKKVAT